MKTPDAQSTRALSDGTPSRQDGHQPVRFADGASNTSPNPPSRPRFQISLTLMLMMMVVFAFVSAALFYAARIPAVREEINVLVYGESRKGEEDIGRLAQRAFIMFTFTSPLLLACVLSTTLSLMKFFERHSK